MASFLKRFPTRQEVILVRNSGLETRSGSLSLPSCSPTRDFSKSTPLFTLATQSRFATRGPVKQRLHPAIIEAASDLFTDGHDAIAIFEAFKAPESRVRVMSGIDESGKQLMGRAFSGTP